MPTFPPAPFFQVRAEKPLFSSNPELDNLVRLPVSGLTFRHPPSFLPLPRFGGRLSGGAPSEWREAGSRDGPEGQVGPAEGTPGSCSPGPGGRRGLLPGAPTGGCCPGPQASLEKGAISSVCPGRQAAEPGAATPKEVAAGGWKEGWAREGEVRGRPAQATFRCDSLANLRHFNIKSA